MEIALRISVPFVGLAATNKHYGGIVPWRIARAARGLTLAVAEAELAP